jgi:hypothetical protein
VADLLKTIAIATISNATVVGLFVWVFKVLFEKSLDRKTKLLEKSLELEHKKVFHQFSRAYDQQAQAIQDTYKSLVSLYVQAQHLAFSFHFFEQHPELLEDQRIPANGNAAQWERYYRATLSEKPEDKRASALTTSASEALEEFRPKRIFFAAPFADEIERLFNLLLYVGSSFVNVNYRDPHTLEPFVAPEVVETWRRCAVACREVFPQLEAEFRKHLAPEQGA